MVSHGAVCMASSGAVGKADSVLYAGFADGRTADRVGRDRKFPIHSANYILLSVFSGRNGV